MKKIGISKSNSKFANYVSWVEQTGYPYEILDWKKNNFDSIYSCTSLLLTGGVDIFPEFYADWENGKNRDDYIPERDGFEFKLLDFALEDGMPLLAICRGMQLVNCRLNGSLLSDIETIRGVNHTKINDTEDRYHDVNIKEGTLLKEVIGKSSGKVNSSHHQGIDRIGEGLIISARSTDGIIEGIEWEDKGKTFLLGIQWHPERMNDKQSPFTKNILERFIEETGKN
ncbi:MAG TPA: gamma-glutamyl-gamma-aminobutyrate hydrolase family protein [Ignavibacteria bacterium]|jgi:putative glutamine amidotransferase